MAGYGQLKRPSAVDPTNLAFVDWRVESRNRPLSKSISSQTEFRRKKPLAGNSSLTEIIPKRIECCLTRTRYQSIGNYWNFFHRRQLVGLKDALDFDWIHEFIGRWTTPTLT